MKFVEPSRLIAHAEPASDLLDIDGFAFEGETRIASDHEQPFEPRKRGDDLLNIPSAKYSCSGSPDMFSNGSTAMDGLSGSGSARGWLTAELTAEGV